MSKIESFLKQNGDPFKLILEQLQENNDDISGLHQRDLSEVLEKALPSKTTDKLDPATLLELVQHHLVLSAPTPNPSSATSSSSLSIAAVALLVHCAWMHRLEAYRKYVVDKASVLAPVLEFIKAASSEPSSSQSLPLACSLLDVLSGYMTSYTFVGVLEKFGGQFLTMCLDLCCDASTPTPLRHAASRFLSRLYALDGKRISKASAATVRRLIDAAIAVCVTGLPDKDDDLWVGDVTDDADASVLQHDSTVECLRLLDAVLSNTAKSVATSTLMHVIREFLSKKLSATNVPEIVAHVLLLASMSEHSQDLLLDNYAQLSTLLIPVLLRSDDVRLQIALFQFVMTLFSTVDAATLEGRGNNMALSLLSLCETTIANPSSVPRVLMTALMALEAFVENLTAEGSDDADESPCETILSLMCQQHKSLLRTLLQNGSPRSARILTSLILVDDDDLSRVAADAVLEALPADGDAMVELMTKHGAGVYGCELLVATMAYATRLRLLQRVNDLPALFSKLVSHVVAGEQNTDVITGQLISIGQIRRWAASIRFWSHIRTYDRDMSALVMTPEIITLCIRPLLTNAVMDMMMEGEDGESEEKAEEAQQLLRHVVRLCGKLLDAPIPSQVVALVAQDTSVVETLLRIAFECPSSGEEGEEEAEDDDEVSMLARDLVSSLVVAVNKHMTDVALKKKHLEVVLDSLAVVVEEAEDVQEEGDGGSNVHHVFSIAHEVLDEMMPEVSKEFLLTSVSSEQQGEEKGCDDRLEFWTVAAMSHLQQTAKRIRKIMRILSGEQKSGPKECKKKKGDCKGCCDHDHDDHDHDDDEMEEENELTAAYMHELSCLRVCGSFVGTLLCTHPQGMLKAPSLPKLFKLLWSWVADSGRTTAEQQRVGLGVMCSVLQHTPTLVPSTQISGVVTLLVAYLKAIPFRAIVLNDDDEAEEEEDDDDDDIGDPDTAAGVLQAAACALAHVADRAPAASLKSAEHVLLLRLREPVLSLRSRGPDMEEAFELVEPVLANIALAYHSVCSATKKPPAVSLPVLSALAPFLGDALECRKVHDVLLLRPESSPSADLLQRLERVRLYEYMRELECQTQVEVRGTDVEPPETVLSDAARTFLASQHIKL